LNEINTLDYIPTFTLHSICETSMGISAKDNPEVQDNRAQYLKDIYKYGEMMFERICQPWLLIEFIFNLTKKGKVLQTISNSLHKFSSEVIKEREKQFTKDDILNINDVLNEEQEFAPKKKLAMLDVLLSAKYRDGSIDDEGIREEVDTFIFEGHDTTGMSLCFTLMLLACNRECQDKAFEELTTVLGDRPLEFSDLNELKYLERCIKESLRLYPSVPMISRISDGIVLSNGYKIPEGPYVNVVMHIFDLHRREDIYPDPEKFDPDRFLPEVAAKRHPYAYIPFSAGPRNCIGQKFAMIEMKAAMVSILRNFILEPVDTPETIVLITDLVLRTKTGIKVKLVPRT